MHLEKIYLKKNEERRLKAGHLWIFSNEIDTQKSPLKKFNAGELVVITTSNNKEVGIGYINPHTLLSVRLLTPNAKAQINENFFVQSFFRSLSLRESLFSQPYYRLVFGESDFLPGLIVDRYDDSLVLQLNTAGIEQLQTPIISALQKILAPKRIILRNDSSARTLEGLASNSEILIGDDSPLMVEENIFKFTVPALEGQKTGWFYDQRPNRTRLSNYVKDKRVLDTFCYVGAWSIQAAAWGAREVHSVDSSKKALSWLMANAEQNNVAQKITTYPTDVFDQLKNFQINKEKFDVIVLDPPALIKKKKDLENGMLAYQRLNELAMSIIIDDGILITCSCSLHLSLEMLINVVRKAGVKMNKEVQIIDIGYQGSDHPIHPAIPETCYLKAVFCRITSRTRQE